MDQNKAAVDVSSENNVSKEVPFVRRTGTVLGIALAAFLTVGGIGVYALVGGGEIPQGDVNSVVETSSVTTVAESDGEEVSETESVTVWAKAGIEEYDLVVETVKATETAKTTTESDVSSEADDSSETVTTTAAEKKTDKAADDKDDSSSDSDSSSSSDDSSDEDEIISCSSKTRYAVQKVNLRKSPSLDADVLLVIAKDAKVSVIGYNSEWYKIKVDGKTGYSMKKYFTADAPESVSSDSDTSSEDSSSASSSASVISYTSDEFDMLCYVLQGEVGSCSDSSKIAVANVIINRVKSSAFPNTISGVLTQANQFTAVSNYYSGTNKPTESTINCAERALAGEDNTNGAIYYYAPKYCSSSAASWFESLTFCMELEGQRFFK